MSRRAKLADVAARAGVSVSAVSLVINGKDAGNIAPATRDRILAAARQLDYRPNSVAQSLRRQRSHAIGLVTDFIASSPFAGRIVTGTMDAASARGYIVLLLDTRGRAEREIQGIAELGRRQVDGLILATMGHTHLAQLPKTALPLVLANCRRPGSRVPSVIPDDVDGGHRAAAHLLGLGHRRVVMLSGPSPDPATGTGSISGPLREEGFAAALREAGHPDPAAAVRVVGWEMDDGYRGGMSVLATPAGRPLPAAERPSAVFVVTDRAAAGVYLAAATLGIRVPQDLSIVGFDDQENLADRLTPPLTTLALPHCEMGEAAAGLLLDVLAGRSVGSEQRPRLLACPLIERASTAPPG